ncbi:TIGR01457 family HAD-type hydrolase [Sporosarcina jiandibaonis]|uniref:TIGR01457 family HAD-type hydrolase n=1 Tax=Sporosarcina jiandibaonis TaxID=2715535 RepID=UPI001552EB2F|nr:TIGR01457 family HAD-type hydrolase [Sporosarcina jiandibaonis]
MKKYNVYCLDLDGTVYHGTEPIPEAVSFIANLQSQGIEPYYITNNSTATPEQVIEKLASFGIRTSVEQIMTSAIVSANYCKKHYDGATVQIIGEKGLHDALVSAGLKIVKENPDIVVVGLDREVNYAKFTEIALAIRSGAKFIATNGDKAIPTERGLLPGAGSIVKLVEFTTGVKPVFIGKPESHMLAFIKEENGYSKDEMVMVGDNYDTDILSGIHYGIDTIYVEGGVTSVEELLSKDKQPTHIVKSLADWQL